MKFVLNDESVKNSHGFYLKNSGGDFTRFNKNPVMLLEHDPKDVIGRWNNLTIEGRQLTAATIFDTDTEKGQRVEGQVNRDFISGASVGIIVKKAEYRHNEALQIDDVWVTEWELLEASIVSIPSNPAALRVKVYADDSTPVEEAQLAAHLDNIVKLSISNSMKLTNEALTALDLPPSATLSEVSAKVVALAARAVELSTQIDSLKAEQAKQVKDRAEALALSALVEGKIVATGKEDLIALATNNYQAAQSVLSAIPARQTYGDKVVPVSMSIGSDRDNWNYHDWKNNAPRELEQLRADRPAEYAEILKKTRKNN